MITPLHTDSLAEVTTLFLDVFSRPPWNDKWESRDHAAKYLGELMGNSNSLSYGFRRNGELVAGSLGYLFHWWQGKEYFIKEFFVSPGMQKQGIGSAFLLQIEEALRKDGANAVLLQTERTVPAYNFYKKNGFVLMDDSVDLVKIL